MLNPMVEFCISNLANGAQKALEVFERDPNIDVLDYGCLGYCGKCANHLFAVVNGDIVEAETADELVAKVYQYIDDNPMF